MFFVLFLNLLLIFLNIMFIGLISQFLRFRMTNIVIVDSVTLTTLALCSVPHQGFVNNDSLRFFYNKDSPTKSHLKFHSPISYCNRGFVSHQYILVIPKTVIRDFLLLISQYKYRGRISLLLFSTQQITTLRLQIQLSKLSRSV